VKNGSEVQIVGFLQEEVSADLQICMYAEIKSVA
jgi:hypothetical protein